MPMYDRLMCPNQTSKFLRINGFSSEKKMKGQNILEKKFMSSRHWSFQVLEYILEHT